MKSTISTIVLLAGAVLCFVLSYVIAQHSDPSHLPEFELKSSLNSGRLTWYTSIPQRHAERIANTFQSRTDIHVKIVRGSTFLIKNRILKEIGANATQADVLTLADVGTFVELAHQGHLLVYPSSHYKRYAPAFKDPGKWVAIAGFGICMAYNRDRIDAPPARWVDLLDPKWKGRIGLEDINTAGSQYGQYYMLRELLGRNFWKELLSSQRPRIYYKTEALANALLDGEIDVAGQFSTHIAYDYKTNRKSPVEGVYPEEGIPFIVNAAAILKQAVHVGEAKLFIDFLISQSGQQFMQRLNYKYSLRQGVAPMDGIPALTRLNLLHPDSRSAFADMRPAYVREFNTYFQVRE